MLDATFKQLKLETAKNEKTYAILLTTLILNQPLNNDTLKQFNHLYYFIASLVCAKNIVVSLNDGFCFSYFKHLTLKTKNQLLSTLIKDLQTNYALYATKKALNVYECENNLISLSMIPFVSFFKFNQPTFNVKQCFSAPFFKTKIPLNLKFNHFIYHKDNAFFYLKFTLTNYVLNNHSPFYHNLKQYLKLKYPFNSSHLFFLNEPNLSLNLNLNNLSLDYVKQLTKQLKHVGYYFYTTYFSFQPNKIALSTLIKTQTLSKQFIYSTKN